MPAAAVRLAFPTAASRTEHRFWQAAYAPGVPGDVDLDRYPSLNEYFDEAVIKYAERPCLVSARTEMSYARLGRLVSALAAWLQAQGVRKGDRVAIMLPNSMQYPVAIFAALRIGAVVVNVNPLYTARELHHQLLDSGAETILVMEMFARTVQQALEGTRVKRVLLTQMGDLLSDGLNLKGKAINFAIRRVKKMVPDYVLPQAVWLNEALRIGGRLTVHRPLVLADDLAFLQYTGGTTGVSKGAMLTHGNVLANCLQGMAFSKPMLEGERLTAVTMIPLYHVYSLSANCLVFMGLGGRNILISNPRDTKLILRSLEGEHFHCIAGVNTMFAALLDTPEFCSRDFSALKATFAGGMATHPSVAERWRQVTGCAIYEGYGLTECSPIVSMQPMERGKVPDHFSGTIGVPVPSTDVRLRRDDGSWAALGEPGEICVRGPQVMQGYWKRPEETAKVLDGQGWLATGDVGVFDEQGFLKIVDRKKDMILVSGFNVYPNEIEAVIAAHPLVKEVAAVGVPDEIAGERIKVVVVPREPSLTVEDVIAHCRANLTGYKIPRIVQIRDTELPKTPVGKILRRELRDA